MSEGSAENAQPLPEVNPRLDEWGRLDLELEKVGPESPEFLAFDDITDAYVAEFQELGGTLRDAIGNPTEARLDPKRVQARIRAHEIQVPGYKSAKKELDVILGEIFTQIEGNVSFAKSGKRNTVNEISVAELVRRRNELMEHPVQSKSAGKHRGLPPQRPIT